MMPMPARPLRARSLRCLINTSILKLDMASPDPGFGADAVIIDLEDGVHASAKALARHRLQECAAIQAQRSDLTFGLRMNSLSTIDGIRDLAAVFQHAERHPGAIAFLQLAKVESAEEVKQCAAVLRALHAPPALMPIIETPRAVSGVDAIAEISDALMFGCVDLAASMYQPNCAYTAYARGRFTVACASRRIPAIDTVAVRDGMNLNDQEGFASTCAASRADGFTGMAVIHPRQVPNVIDAFRVDEHELELHRRKVRAYAQADTGFAICDGEVIAPPFVAHSSMMLDVFSEHGTAS